MVVRAASPKTDATGNDWFQPLPNRFQPAVSVSVSPGTPGVELSKTLQPIRATCVVVVVVATVLVVVVVGAVVVVVRNGVLVVVVGATVVVVRNAVLVVVERAAVLVVDF